MKGFFCPWEEGDRDGKGGEKKRRNLKVLKKWWNNLALGLLPPRLPTHSCRHCRDRTCCAEKWHLKFCLDWGDSSKAHINFVNIKTTPQMSGAILLLLAGKIAGFILPALRFPPSSPSLSSPFFISYSSIPLHFLVFSFLFVIINPACPRLKLLPLLLISFSPSFFMALLHPPLLYHHLHSCRHRNNYAALLPTLPFLLHSLFALLISPPPITAIDPWLCSRSSSSSSSPWSPPPRGAVFVCVGCTVLYKSCMLMLQRAIKHCREWTNFRSAWPRFITAHKPKVSCVRWRGESVPCSTWIIYHRSALPLLPVSSLSYLSAVQILPKLQLMSLSYSLFLHLPLACLRVLILSSRQILSVSSLRKTVSLRVTFSLLVDFMGIIFL